MRIHGVLKRLLPMCTVLLVCLVSMPGSVLGADVDVYGEGVYADNLLTFKIYADISSGPILSFGVKVNYPAGLSVSSATKNEEVWYFGDGGADYSYMNPENDGSSVIIIGGKLDTNYPTEGVEGDRVLLGTILFDCTGYSFGHPINDPAPITMELGRGGDYANFVDTNGNELDTPDLFSTVTIAKKGDANLDDRVNTQDMSVVRSTMTSGGVPYLWIDCTLDGRINTQDMSCVRSIITN